MAPTTILNGIDRLLTIEQAADILAGDYLINGVSGVFI
jgi:hypothetical protein